LSVLESNKIVCGAGAPDPAAGADGAPSDLLQVDGECDRLSLYTVPVFFFSTHSAFWLGADLRPRIRGVAVSWGLQVQKSPVGPRTKPPQGSGRSRKLMNFC